MGFASLNSGVCWNIIWQITLFQFYFFPAELFIPFDGLVLFQLLAAFGEIDIISFCALGLCPGKNERAAAFGRQFGQRCFARLLFG